MDITKPLKRFKWIASARRVLNKTNRWALILLNVWLLLNTELSLANEDFRFIRLLESVNQNGNGIGATTSITQDQYGYIWVAGENGVIKYDGINTKHYVHTPNATSLTSNFARVILTDYDGVIWVGTDLGLCFLDNRIDNFRCFLEDKKTAGLSNSTIYALELAPDNTLYIGTQNGLNILSPDRKVFSHYFHHELDRPGHPLSNISSLMLDNNQLWIGTLNKGYGILDLTTLKTQLFPLINDINGLSNFPKIRDIMKDTQDRIWISTYGRGIRRISADGKTIKTYSRIQDDPNSIGSDVVWKSYQDSEGVIWFATDHGGLARFDEDIDQFTHFRHDPYDKNSLSSDQVRTIFEDRSGNLLVGSFPHGVNYVNRTAQVIQHWSTRPNSNVSLTHSAVLSFLEDKQGHIWVGTENGLNEFNPKDQTFQHYLPNKGVKGFLQAGAVLSLEEDTKGNIWIGSWSGGLHQLDPQTKELHYHAVDKSNPHALHDNFIWKLLWDEKNQLLFIATENDGLNVFDPSSNTFSRFNHDPFDSNSISSNFVLNLLQDKNGYIWIATTDGIDRFDISNKKFTHFKSKLTTDHVTPLQLEAERFRSLATDNQGRIWIGTQNTGLFILDPTTETAQQISIKDGLPSNYIASLIIDRVNQMWVTTPNGAAKIDLQDLSKISVFTTDDGLVGNHYNRDATLIDRRGMIYLGGIDGVSRFFPQQIVNTVQYSPVQIQDFRILNQSVKPGDVDSPLTKPIINTRSIELQHHHSMFTFEYLAMNFSAPNAFEYAYKLEGFDQHWNYVGKKRFATYTNLNQGKYTFLVKSRPENRSWPDTSTEIEITILPPPWLTPWAYFVYFIIGILVIAFIIRLQYKRLELIAEKALNVELIQLNKIKDAFLANTSHELRTPLNGIIGIAESVYEEAKEKMETPFTEKLHLIAQSGKRLSRLINDILDYSKMGKNKLCIYPQPVDIVHIVNNCISLLQPLADEKSIQLRQDLPRQLPLVFVDENRLQQILLNLVGNGIKFTQSGYVEIRTLIRVDHLEIHVKDTGIGIPSNQQQQIFEAFHQIQDDSISNAMGGTGLGLAVTKELIELQGGTIHLDSEIGVGSTFVFSIPIYTKQTTQAKPEPSGQLSLDLDNEKVGAGQIAPICSAPVGAENVRILIVDDDPVNRMVLSSMLQLHHYQVIEANDGQHALEVFNAQPIDLVILDIMMPNMSGFEVCRILRKDYPIHILPIMFLTAKKVDEDVSKGFSVGATEFLSKPVSKYEILPRVANHVRLLMIYRNLSRDTSPA